MEKIWRTVWRNRTNTALLMLAWLALVLILWGTMCRNKDEKSGTPPRTSATTTANTGGNGRNAPHSNSGALLGIVRDKNGGVVAGATVRAVNRADAKTTEIKSDSGGLYSMTLPEGKYVVVAQKPGFEASLVDGVTIASAITQNLILTPSGQANPPPGMNNPEGYVFRNGTAGPQDVKVVLAAQGTDPKRIKNVSEVALSGDGMAIQYRDGQSVASYPGALNGERAWKAQLSDGTAVYVQKKCGNIIVPPSPSAPKIIYATPPSPPPPPQRRPEPRRPEPAPAPQSFTVTIVAEATATASASCNGTKAEATGYGRAEATITSPTYDGAYKKAVSEAQKQAQKAATASAKANVNVSCEAAPSPALRPTPTPTASPTPTTTPTAIPTASPTPTATPTASPTPTVSPTPTAMPSPTPSPTATPTPTASPTPTPTPTLLVSVSPQPNAGSAPLDVDVVITVSGTAEGLIRYRLDCTNDGVWEREIVTDSTTWHANGICRYTIPGEHTVRVEARRPFDTGPSVGGTSTIIVTQ
ncbi:MAG: hypothetical protein A3D59_02480 [Candidatus Wildermuthbacteria bacterium RIFCSPHIGHO2_02_FULL_47_17]|uniref:Uncharacterized protein n=1 Tax=Candidatus Wildermuthbacteria bacterium RIFCSPHIGHO2_02_FULL_47_17 TaxID=1802452 RepID=A0A1G2R542_9BACT|nr:MAG: hypothetical protein A3D59_02480 [Candidatus Wildermuthbacteria bacterium RIFCSPHIGHO2_02_FULL_47_17]